MSSTGPSREGHGLGAAPLTQGGGGLQGAARKSLGMKQESAGGPSGMAQAQSMVRLGFLGCLEASGGWVGLETLLAHLGPA